MTNNPRPRRYHFDADAYRAAIENETNPTWYWYKAALFHVLEQGLALRNGLRPHAAVALADHYILGEKLYKQSLTNAKRNYKQEFASDPDVLALVPIRKGKKSKPSAAFLHTDYASFADTDHKHLLLQAIIKAYELGSLHQKAAVTLCRAHIKEEYIDSALCINAERYYRQAYAHDVVRQALIAYRINNFDADLYKDAADTELKQAFLSVLARGQSSCFDVLAEAYIRETSVDTLKLRGARDRYRKVFALDSVEWALLKRLQDALPKSHHKKPGIKKSIETVVIPERHPIKPLLVDLIALSPMTPVGQSAIAFFVKAIIAGQLPGDISERTIKNHRSAFNAAFISAASAETSIKFHAAITDGHIPPAAFGFRTTQELQRSWEKALRRQRRPT